MRVLGKLRGGDLFFLHPGGEGKGDEEAHISVEVHTRRNHKNHFFFNRHWNIFLQLQTVTLSAGYFLLERAFKYTCCKLCLEQLSVTATICQYVLIRIGNQRITLKIISFSVVKATVVRSVDWSPVKVITVSLPPLLLNFLSWSNALNESLGFISALTLLLYIASFDSYANTILHHV